MKYLANTFLITCIAAVVALGDPGTQPTTQPVRGDTLTVSTVIHAPAAEIFECFTTGPGFARAMGVAKAKVDFRVGGQIRSAYRADVELDSDRAIVNTILAYEPNRMLAMKATAPAGSPDWLLEICRTGWSVITLDAVSADITRVTVKGMGFEAGGEFDTAYQFFKQGNTATLELMKKRLGRADAVERGKRALELLQSCAGGAFAMQHPLSSGKTLHGSAVWRGSLEGKFLIVDGALGDEKSLRPHAVLLCGWDHAVEAPYFVQTMDTGATARGYLDLLNDQTVGGTWRFDGPDGVSEWYISFDFSTPGQYTSRRWKGDAPVGEPVMTLVYTRTGR